MSYWKMNNKERLELINKRIDCVKEYLIRQFGDLGDIDGQYVLKFLEEGLSKSKEFFKEFYENKKE